MSSSHHTPASPSPLFLRVLVVVWLVIQLLILVFILATHGARMDPDLRLLGAAATALASFPSSLASMYVTLHLLEKLSSHGLLFNALVTWASCFFAGGVQLWLLGLLVGRIRRASQSGRAGANQR